MIFWEWKYKHQERDSFWDSRNISYQNYKHYHKLQISLG